MGDSSAFSMVHDAGFVVKCVKIATGSIYCSVVVVTSGSVSNVDATVYKECRLDCVETSYMANFI